MITDNQELSRVEGLCYGRRFLPGLRKFARNVERGYFKYNPLTAVPSALLHRRHGIRLHGGVTVNPSLKASLSRTPEGRKILELLKGEAPETYGAFLPGFMKVVKKVGKFTSPITSAIAKAVIPSSIVDALSKADPTAHSQLMDALSKSASVVIADVKKGEQHAVAAVKTNPIPKVAIVGAGALVAVLLLARRK